MPVITVVNKEKSVEVNEGSNLRKVLLENELNPYKGLSKVLNCGGHGKCGRCAVELLDSNHHKVEVERSCQITVAGDMTINLHPVK